ncbi:MAG TPA: cytochrome c peroxidase [Candidatus Xenobia bacterium]
MNRCWLVLLALLAGQAAAWTPPGVSARIWQGSVPPTNPVTPEKVALGRRLFTDRRLSGPGKISCVSCHDPRRALSQGKLRLRRHDGPLLRRAPSLYNAMFLPGLMWDGRAPSLEAQARIPIYNKDEMAMPSARELVRRVRADAGYRTAFLAAFGGPPTEPRIMQALACFERTLVSFDSPFDRYMAGQANALSARARRGWSLFKGRGRCIVCHYWSPVAPLFTDFHYHNLGVWDGDMGRFLISHRMKDRGAFRTPTLYNVALDGPYLHNGSIGTLRDVLLLHAYAASPDPKLRPLHLTKTELRELEAFLRSLTGEGARHLSGLTQH